MPNLRACPIFSIYLPKGTEPQKAVEFMFTMIMSPSQLSLNLGTDLPTGSGKAMDLYTVRICHSLIKYQEIFI